MTRPVPTIRLLLSGLLAAAAIASPVAAQDLTGSWDLSVERGRRGPQTMTLALVQDGAELTGTLTMRAGGRRRGGGGGGGGGQSGTREIEITDGAIDGSDFSFMITLSFNGNSISQIYSGTFAGDEMSGEVSGGRGGARPFTGKRGS